MYGLKELRLRALICSLHEYDKFNDCPRATMPLLFSVLYDCLILLQKLYTVKGELDVASSLVNYFMMTLCG